MSKPRLIQGPKETVEFLGGLRAVRNPATTLKPVAPKRLGEVRAQIEATGLQSTWRPIGEVAAPIIKEIKGRNEDG